MTYRALTVAREHESGGDRVADLVARRLGWKLIDSALLEEIAHNAHVDPQLARKFDERVDSWVHRVSRRALWYGAFDAVAVLPETAVFDAETMALLARAAIEHACELGNCVIVGRGSQCILRQHADVFHVFLFAPFADRVASARQHMRGKADAPRWVQAIDDERARYVRMNFGRDWRDPHLYDLMISSKLGEELVVPTILSAMGVPV
jgi:cytidylate kinase